MIITVKVYIFQIRFRPVTIKGYLKLFGHHDCSNKGWLKVSRQHDLKTVVLEILNSVYENMN